MMKDKWCLLAHASPPFLILSLRGKLSVWQRYLPVTTELGKVPFWFYHTPQPVIEQLEKAQKRHLFDRIEIWSRAGDPMAVGVMGGERTRYFSIARWGDAKLTLEQVKRRLRVENWISSLIPMIFIFSLFVTLALTLDLWFTL